jgi:hypothetical protein
MLKLYTDRKTVFECKIKIENAQLNNAKVRLMLYDKQMDFAFIGKIDGDGNCKIEIPALKKLDNKTGSAVLEVMVDGGYFEPLMTDYKLVSRKVTVENVSVIDKSNQVKVEIEEVSNEVKVKVEEISNQIPVEVKELPKKLPYRYLKTECGEKNIKLVKMILDNYKKLNKRDFSILKETIKATYKPNTKIFNWGRKVFNNPKSLTANMVMYKIENMS